MLAIEQKQETTTVAKSKVNKNQEEINAFGKSLKRQILIDKIIVGTLLGFGLLLSIYIALNFL